MSINYFEGTISVGSAHSSDDARKAIATAVATVPGWSVLDNGYTESNIARSVLKCHKESSGLPNDFFVIMHNTTTAHTTMYLSVCEGYDEATHTITYGAIRSHGTDGTSRRTGTHVVNNSFDSDTGTSTHSTAIHVAAAKTWQVCVYSDGIAFGSGNNSTVATYVGAFASLLPETATNDPMPLSQSSLTTANNIGQIGTAGPWALSTRFAMNPNMASGGSIASLGQKMLIPTPQASYVKGGASVSAFQLADPYTGTAGVQASPVLLINNTYANGSTAQYGSVRGRLKNVLYTTGTAELAGDTMTVNGAVYTKLCNNTNYWFRKS